MRDMLTINTHAVHFPQKSRLFSAKWVILRMNYITQSSIEVTHGGRRRKRSYWSMPCMRAVVLLSVAARWRLSETHQPRGLMG